MSRKRTGILFMLLGAVFILSSLTLFVYNQLENYNARVSATQIVERLSKSSNGTVIDGNEFIGVLSIPTLDLELPVMAECSYEKLETAPCRYFGSLAGGNLVIAGHNYTSNFGKIYTLAAGDKIIFTDGDGNEYTFEVAETQYLLPTDVQKMIESDYPLTLYTCTYGAAKRVTVRCQYTEQ